MIAGLTAERSGYLATTFAAAAGWLVADGPFSAAGRLAAGRPGLLPRSDGSGSFRRLLVHVRHATGTSAARLLISGVAIFAMVISLVPSLVLSIAGFVLWRRWKEARRVSAQTRQRTRDVDLLRALTAELRSGLPPAEALLAAGGSVGEGTQDGRKTVGIGARMVAAAAAEALGGDAASVLSAGAEPGSPEAALGAAWAVCQHTGARLAAPVSRIAAGAAANLRTAREADAALAGARSSAHLLAALPVAGIGLGSLSGTGSIHVLLTTGFGQLCLVIGVGLDLAGLAWLDRLAAGHA